MSPARRRLPRAGVLAAAVLASALAAGAAPALASPVVGTLTPHIDSFPARDASSATLGRPEGITTGPDGALWFTDAAPDGGGIGRMSTDGTLTLHAAVPSGTTPGAIAAGPDGALWLTSGSTTTSATAIERVDASGTVTSVGLTTIGADPRDLVAGPDGALWFTDAGARRIGRLPATTPPGNVDETRMTGSAPGAIAAGADGGLWYTLPSAGLIGRSGPTGTETTYALPSGVARPSGITAGPDGALWYTATTPATVVRLATDGTQTAFPLPAGSTPGDLAAGGDGALWVDCGDEICRVSATDGSVTTYPLPNGVAVGDLTAGPDGNVWFTEPAAGRIGRITTPPTTATGGVSAIASPNATVGATVDGHAQATSVVVEYGTSLADPTETSAPVTLPASGASGTPAILLSDLPPLSSYRYRVLATNQTGSTTGEWRTFWSGPFPVAPVAGVLTFHSAKVARDGTIALVLSANRTGPLAVRATTRFAVAAPSKGKNKAKRTRLRSLTYGRASATVTALAPATATVRIRPATGARALLTRRSASRRVTVLVSGTLTAGGQRVRRAATIALTVPRAKVAKPRARRHR